MKTQLSIFSLSIFVKKFSPSSQFIRKLGQEEAAFYSLLVLNLNIHIYIKNIYIYKYIYIFFREKLLRQWFPDLKPSIPLTFNGTILDYFGDKTLGGHYGIAYY